MVFLYVPRCVRIAEFGGVSGTRLAKYAFLLALMNVEGIAHIVVAIIIAPLNKEAALAVQGPKLRPRFLSGNRRDYVRVC